METGNKLILTLNMPFVSLNEYIDAERANRQAGAKIKKQQTFSVQCNTLSQKFKLEKGLYDVKFTWHKPDNRKDHDNIAFAKKFILDGIVAAKGLPSDGPKYINNFSDSFICDKVKKYVWCEVEFEAK